MKRGAPASFVGSILGTGAADGARATKPRHPLSFALVAVLAFAVTATLGVPQALADTAPAVTIAAPTAVTARTAHLSGTVDPQGGPSDAIWHFEYSTDDSSWIELESHDAGSGSGPVDVAEEIGNTADPSKRLQPNTTYYVRLVAANVGGRTVSATPDPSFTTAAAPPQASTLPAFALRGGTEALLGGLVNPRNSATHYWVEYGGDTGYGTSVPATKDAAAGSGNEITGHVERIGGLTPNTTYHFRLVAENQAGLTRGQDLTFTSAPTESPVTQACPNRAFRTEQIALAIPDCRAWEKVSPADKGSYDISGDIFFGDGQSSAGGDGVIYQSLGAFANAPSGASPNTYLARRGADGWNTQAISPSDHSGLFIGYTSQYFTFDESLAHGFVTTNEPQTSEAAPKVDNLYLRDNLTGTYTLISTVAPPASIFGAPLPYLEGASADLSHVLFSSSASLTPEAPADSSTKLYEWVDGTLRLASILPNGEPVPYPGIVGGPGLNNALTHRISADGSKVFFAVRGEEGLDDLYVRENGTSTTHFATHAVLLDASVDGSHVLFIEHEELKEYDVEDGSTTVLSPDAEPADGSTAEAESVVATTGDLSYVYFTARGRIVAGQPVNPEDTGGYLYVWHDGAVHYVANLANGAPDAQLGMRGSAESGMSADGSHLAFISKARVTSYDNRGIVEVYGYDAATGQVQCLSCSPTGAAPTTAASFFGSALPAGSGQFQHEHRVISADGARVFFQTAEKLVPEDTNGKVDVYEWSEGAVHLISSGQGAYDARLIDASASGNDVFFVTRNQLVGSDDDQLADLYDARVGGGFPNPPSASAPCADEGCHGQPGQAPPGITPASASYSGPGNAKARKQQRRRHRHKHKSHRRHMSHRQAGSAR